MLKSLQKPSAGTSKKLLVSLYILIGVLFAVVFALGSMVVEYKRAPSTSDASATNTSTSSDLLEKPAAAKEATSPVTDLTNSTLSSLPFTTIKDCGYDAASARAKGCVFDVMMQLWMSPECYDGTLSERYLAAGNWTWYADTSGENIYSDTEIRLGNHDVVFVAQDYHKHHCVFAWEKLVRALRNQGPIIEELISYDHVAHCEHKTLFRTDAVRGVSAPTGYTRCAYYDVWKNNLPANKLSSSE